MPICRSGVCNMKRYTFLHTEGSPNVMDRAQLAYHATSRATESGCHEHYVRLGLFFAPRSPPRGMKQRKIQHHVAAGSPHVHSGSGLRPKFRSPDLDVPEMKLTDVVPALYSSPRIGPQLIRDIDEHSRTRRSGLQDVHHGSESHPNPHGNVRPVKEGWLIDRDHRISKWLTFKI
jgi:hypothetical protein